MLHSLRNVVTVIFALAASNATALDGYPAAVLFSSETNSLGETIRYPTTGPARVTAAIVTIAPGMRTEVHKHGVPLFIYVLEGEVTVDYGDRGIRKYAQGESFLEAMAVAHTGINTGGQPVRILAVYMGAEGSENVIPVVSGQNSEGLAGGRPSA